MIWFHVSVPYSDEELFVRASDAVTARQLVVARLEERMAKNSETWADYSFGPTSIGVEALKQQGNSAVWGGRGCARTTIIDHQS